jgi:hypothetical protein
MVLYIDLLWVGIATRYGLDGSGIESRWGGGAKFSAPVQTGPAAHPSTYDGYRVFPGCKAARSWRGVNQPPHLAPGLKKE